MRILKGFCQALLVSSIALNPANAQAPLSYDSSVIPAKRMAQQNDFWNNNYNFPAQPRNQWEAGASFGMLSVSGDVAAKIPTLGFEAHVRKAFGYLFSLRLQYVNGNAKGMNWFPASSFLNNDAWLDNGIPGFSGNLPNGKGYNPDYRDNSGNMGPLNPGLNNGRAQNVFYNYKAHVQDLSLQGIISISNIRFHKKKTGFSLYGGGGIGMTVFKTKVNALDASGNTYTNLFDQVVASLGGVTDIAKRKDILKQLRDGMDNTYETDAESEVKRADRRGRSTKKPSGTVIAGLSFKLNNRFNLYLEDRHTFIKSDLLDGQQWQAHAYGNPVQTRDFDSWNFGSIGINVNLGAKAVEPLWWLNPLDYSYSELNQPKHMKLPKPVFEDTDGDGVTDQLDREPNTPAGCPVDTHGVTADADGDGVPDCKDKQLITPSECQPVDADGVGTCPEPACCTDITNKLKDGTLGGGNDKNVNCPADYPSITMKGTGISGDNKSLLAKVAEKLKSNPDCKITLTAYPKANKRQQALANKKLEALKNYLVEKLGISEDRIAADLQIEGGDENVIDIK